MAVFGGIVVSLIVGLIATFFGFFFGDATRNPVVFWLLATATPAVVLGLLYLATIRTQGFKKGVLVGLCVWTLVAGLCNAGMTAGFKEMPTFGK